MTRLAEVARVTGDAERLLGMVGRSRGEFYTLEIERVQSENPGMSVTKAAAIVAEANGVSAGNVISQRGSYRRSQGLSEGRATPKRPAKANGTAPAEDWTPPEALADILDELKKGQQLQARAITGLTTWAQRQEKSVAEAKEKARDAALRAIREATEKL